MIKKELAPNELPATKKAQAEATAEGSTIGQYKGSVSKQAWDAAKIGDLTQGVEEIIKNSTGSGLGTMIDNLAGFFGHATKGSIAAGTLAVLQASLLRYVPRMEGPQSDADRRVYEKAVGDLANTSIPVERRLGSLRMVQTLAKKYQFYGDVYTPTGSTGEYAPVAPATPAATGKTSTGVNWSIQ